MVHLAPGTYHLGDTTWEFNASTEAAEIRLVGDGAITLNANATSKRQAGVTVLDPTDSELPDHIKARIDSLRAEEATLLDTHQIT